VLSISDEGRGFRDESEAMSRGTSEAGSTGLGLDIVRRMAELAGGGVAIGRSPTGGAEVMVELGPPTGTTAAP
jgi:signal transduction histidine kinase